MQYFVALCIMFVYVSALPDYDPIRMY